MLYGVRFKTAGEKLVATSQPCAKSPVQNAGFGRNKLLSIGGAGRTANGVDNDQERRSKSHSVFKDLSRKHCILPRQSSITAASLPHPPEWAKNHRVKFVGCS